MEGKEKSVMSYTPDLVKARGLTKLYSANEQTVARSWLLTFSWKNAECPNQSCSVMCVAHMLWVQKCPFIQDWFALMSHMRGTSAGHFAPNPEVHHFNALFFLLIFLFLSDSRAFQAVQIVNPSAHCFIHIPVFCLCVFALRGPQVPSWPVQVTLLRQGGTSAAHISLWSAQPLCWFA